MTHRERAAKVLAELPCPSEKWSKECHDLLEAQFREVERESDHLALDLVNAKLREVVRAGDVLSGRLECFQWTGDSTPQEWPTPASVQEAAAAWDAATKGISRE